MEISTVGNYRTTWGEGAIWWHGRLLYVDIEGHKVIRFDPVTGVEECWDVGQRVGTVVPRVSGGFVIAGDHGFAFLNDATGEVTPISDPEPDKKPDNRFNDGKCSPDGRFFAGTISLVKKAGDAKLYCLEHDGTVREAFGPVTNSNGIAWSADGHTVYYIDTPQREIFAFDYRNGHLENLRTVVETGHIDASPDGMTIDAGGNLWVAFCHAGCVACFDPRTGLEINRVNIPCVETTSCAFGGAELDELYITTGVHKSIEEADAGRLFVVRGLGVKGLPAYGFAG